MFSVKEPHWEMIFAVDTVTSLADDDDVTLTLTATWLDSSSVLEGRVARLAHMREFNMSVFKSDRVNSWEYVKQVSLSFHSQIIFISEIFDVSFNFLVDFL